MREKTVIRVIRRYKDRLQVFGNKEKIINHIRSSEQIFALFYDFDKSVLLFAKCCSVIEYIL